MNIKLAYAGCEPRKEFESVLQRTLESFQDSLPAREVRVKVTASEKKSPPYGIRAQFLTAGADCVAEASDFTLTAALRKLVLELLQAIRQRTPKLERRRDEPKAKPVKAVKARPTKRKGKAEPRG